MTEHCLISFGIGVTSLTMSRIMAASMRRAAFSFSPGQIRQLRTLCKSLGIEYVSLKLEAGLNLDFRWARINTLIMGIEEWKLRSL
jgi:hypothetical protein